MPCSDRPLSGVSQQAKEAANYHFQQVGLEYSALFPTVDRGVIRLRRAMPGNHLA